MDKVELKRKAEWLINNPGRTDGTFHDAGYCWILIEYLLDQVRALRAENKGQTLHLVKDDLQDK